MTACVKVLAVDDAPAIRVVLERLLTAAGCQVVAAAGARDALRALRVFRPDVILTDYNMPHIDGAGFVRLVRRTRRLENTPILVLSSEECPHIRQAMRSAGADAWLSKPIDPPTLAMAVYSAARLPNVARAARAG